MNEFKHKRECDKTNYTKFYNRIFTEEENETRKERENEPKKLNY